MTSPPIASQSTLSWVLNLYTIVAAATLIVSGVLVERLGRKRMLLARGRRSGAESQLGMG